MQVPNQAETPLAAVRACLEQLGHTVGIAHRLVLAGKHVDLTGLDADMGFVCARALDLPPDEGRALRRELINLRSEIEALTAALALQAPPPG